MGLNEQMAAVDQLMRRPQDLSAILSVGDDVAQIAATVDPERAAAVHAVFAELVVARWWQPRFPATVAALRHFLGEGCASWLVGQAGFLSAEGEDLRGSALGRGVLRLIELQAEGASEPAGLDQVPEWLLELCAYEYLLAVGLPRRAAGEALDAELEQALLPDATWLQGGRLSHEVLVVPFAWPIADLQEEPHDADPDPHLRVFWVEGSSAAEVDAPHIAGDALALLAAGADDAAIEALDEDGAAALAWLQELGLLRAQD